MVDIHDFRDAKKPKLQAAGVHQLDRVERAQADNPQHVGPRFAFKALSPVNDKPLPIA